MPRLIDADTLSKASIKAILKHAKTVVETEIANGTIFDESTIVDDGHVPHQQLTGHNIDHNGDSIDATNSPHHSDLVGMSIPKATMTTSNEVDVRRTSALPNHNIPKFDISEIHIGRVVGRGGYCVVSEVREIRLVDNKKRGQSPNSATADRSSDNNSVTTTTGIASNRFWRRGNYDSDSVLDVHQTKLGAFVFSSDQHNGVVLSRSQLAASCNKSNKYVIKQLNDELINMDRRTFLKGIIGIAMEAKFLASLNHRNIITIRGESRRTPFENSNYFIVIDYLPVTLPNQLNKWMHIERATKGITGFFTNLGKAGTEHKVNRLMADRLLVVYDIAAAGNYLHQKNVIFRDFKPDNVGFTSDGVTKLIDFGLARELTNLPKDENGLYLLTGVTGGIRYMAPEVGLRKPYNKKADIYSWSMIFWYVLSLEPPLCLYTPEMIIDRVFKKGHRPATKVTWPTTLTDLIRRCWSENERERPEFEEIMNELSAIASLVDTKTSGRMTTAKT